jgi:hypothetical protein
VASLPRDARPARTDALPAATAGLTSLPPVGEAPAQAPVSPAGLWRVQQPPMGAAAFEADGDESPAGQEPYPIQLEPPEMQKVAESMQSDATLQERMRQEHRQRARPQRITFPESPVLSTDTYRGRSWEPRKLEVAPNYVVYERLYFEQKNFERYGWDLGPVTPVLSAGAFFWDIATFPYHVGTDPCRRMDSNFGYCLPGDPVPLLLYPPEISFTGFLTETATVLALVAIFP